MRGTIGFFLLVVLVGCGEKRGETAMEKVRMELKDPSSAQFRNVVSYTEEITCGEVNAKNAYGGYVGFKDFIYFGNTKGMEFKDEVRLGEKVSSRDIEMWCNDSQDKYLAYLKAQSDNAVTVMTMDGGPLSISKSACEDKSKDPESRSYWCDQMKKKQDDLEQILLEIKRKKDNYLSAK